MEIVSFQIEKQKKEALAALAQTHGGVSALLRQLVNAVLQQGVEPPQKLEAKGHLVVVKTRVTVSEAKAVRAAAASKSMKVGQFLRSLIRVKLGAGPQFSNEEIIALRNLTVEVARIGVNLNQLVRAINRAQKAGDKIEVDLQRIDETKSILEKTRQELIQVAQGNVRYWDAE